MCICVGIMWKNSCWEKSCWDQAIDNIVLSNEKNLILGIEPIREFCCLAQALSATILTKPYLFVG